VNAEANAAPPKPRVRDVLRQPRMVAILLLGAASGLPNPLSEATMQAWLTDLGLSNTKIGLLMYVALPYLLKPLWAPLIDRFDLPWLGRRRGWIFTIQWLLAGAIASLAMFGGAHQLTMIALVLLAVVFLSASLDIVIDAYRTDVARPEERGLAVHRIGRRRQRELARRLPHARRRDGAHFARDPVGTRAG
jgi:MFS family permease